MRPIDYCQNSASPETRYLLSYCTGSSSTGQLQAYSAPERLARTQSTHRWRNLNPATQVSPRTQTDDATSLATRRTPLPTPNVGHTQTKLLLAHMAGDIDDIVHNCKCFARNNIKYCQKRIMPLFPASGAFNFAAMDIVEPFPQTAQGGQYIFVISDRYYKLAGAVTTSKKTATYVWSVIVDHWRVPSGSPTYLLTDSETQFVSKFFATVCAQFGSKHLTFTAFQPLTNGSAERFNETVFTRLRDHVAKHQKN